MAGIEFVPGTFDDTRWWPTLPIVGFDLETTGLDTKTDRIVTAALVHNDCYGRPVSRGAILTDPGIEIPEGAAAVHGITTELAREQGAGYPESYAAMRNYLDAQWADGAAVCVYNAPYDLSMMHYEGLRLGYPPLRPGIVLDPLVLDRAMTRKKGSNQSRKLKPTTEHYKVRLDAEHDAIEDVLGTLRILWKMRQHQRVGRWQAGKAMRLQQVMYRQRGEELREYFEGKDNHERAATVGTEWPVQL